MVRPPRDLAQFHAGLIAAGAARYFGAPFEGGAVRPLREADAVAERVRALLGCEPPVAAGRAPRSAPAPEWQHPAALAARCTERLDVGADDGAAGAPGAAQQ